MRRRVNRALRGTLTGMMVLAVWLGSGGPATAGVYTEVERLYLPGLDKFQFWLAQVRDVAVNPTAPARSGSLKAQYQREVQALEAKPRGEWTTLDRINLGGCYIRMGRYDEAGKVLRGADPHHFLVLHNLAALSFAQGQFQRAVDYQEEALKAWPGVWVWWSNAEMKFFRRAEEYYLALLRIRNEDTGPITNVDPLFEKVRLRPRPGGRGERGKAGLALAIREPLRFVGADGKTYEPGGLAWAQDDKLPLNADLLVLQLLLWHPNDLRLEWLLAEIMNVRGFPDAAYVLMDGLVRKGGSGIVLLKEHRRELMQVLKVTAALRNPKAQLKSHLLGVAMARGMPTPAGLGAVGNEVMAWLPVRLEELAATGQLGPTPPARDLDPRRAAAPALPSWRPLTVSFIFGMAVAGLLGLQLREWRRRRAAAPPAAEPAEVPAAAGPEGTTDDGTARPSPE